MGNGFHTVGMVVGISVNLSLRILSGGSMYMRHCAGLRTAQILSQAETMNTPASENHSQRQR